VLNPGYVEYESQIVDANNNKHVSSTNATDFNVVIIVFLDFMANILYILQL
jgi:hypothetical protein